MAERMSPLLTWMTKLHYGKKLRFWERTLHVLWRVTIVE